MISACLGSASHSRNGEPFAVWSCRTMRLNSVISFRAPSPEPSSPRTFTISASFSSFANHRRSSSSSSITKSSRWSSDVIVRMSAQARVEFSNLEFDVRRRVHDCCCEGIRRVSRSVQALEQQSTPSLSRSFQRQLHAHSSPGYGEWKCALLMSMDMSMDILARLFLAIIKLIMSRTASKGGVALKTSSRKCPS